MLIARHHSGVLVQAASAHRLQAHRCPVSYCRCPVTLRRGGTAVPHFAHSEPRPHCPLYSSGATTSAWDGSDSRAVRQAVLLDGNALLVTTDPVARLRCVVEASMVNTGRTPRLELLQHQPTLRDRMIFSVARQGSRIWSGESLHEGEEYLAVSSRGDTHLAIGAEVALLNFGEKWRAQKFTLPASLDQSGAGWLDKAGVLLRPARGSATGGDRRAASSDGSAHFARLGTGLAMTDVDVSGRNVKVVVSTGMVDVECPHLDEPVHITLTSAFVTPHVEETTAKRRKNGQLGVAMRLRTFADPSIPGSVDAAYVVQVLFGGVS